MNFGTGTGECWAESLNGSWQMRWPACFYAHLELQQPKGFEAFLPKSCSCAAFRQA